LTKSYGVDDVEVHITGVSTEIAQCMFVNLPLLHWFQIMVYKGVVKRKGQYTTLK
jgi:hypothetical protein